MENYPPYNITDKMLNYVSEIMEKIGKANYFETLNRYPELMRKRRIKSIHSSLAIEDNKLNFSQVEAVINGKTVIGEQKDIQEVKNAYRAYENLDEINPYSLEDLKKIHGIMTFLIEEDAGKFRNHGEGVYDGDKCVFMAPPAKMVPGLMENLFKWMKEVKNKVNPLILSCIFHYEFVFIHPFSDGNGRTARLWQTAILADWKELFKYLPIESIIKENQEKYYKAISASDAAGNSNSFIEFMLEIINKAIDGVILEQSTIQKTAQETTQETTQEKILNLVKNNPQITQNEMAKILNLTRDGISYHIKVLKENGILKREGSTKNGIWVRTKNNI